MIIANSHIITIMYVEFVGPLPELNTVQAVSSEEATQTMTITAPRIPVRGAMTPT